MSAFENEFFEGKREWSLLKDTVIEHYLEPYLKKIKTLNKKIILVDSFAGPGIFEDGSKGSPLIICEAADKFLPGNYEIFLINKNPIHHEELTKNLHTYIESGKVHTLNRPANEFLSKLANYISDQVVFIYLDPFGVVGLEYSNLLPFFARSKKYSTELLINFSVPTILRLSCYQRVRDLQKSRAKRKFLSCEPLLGPLKRLPLKNIDWVIVGGESGRKPRPMEKLWVEGIRNQCKESGAKFFFKQWGGTNKKKTGRILNGRTYDDMPDINIDLSSD